MKIYTAVKGFFKALSTNATDASSFPSKVPTTTEPTTTAIDVTRGDTTYNNILILPYGVGSDNNTMLIRLIGWKKIGTLWIPVPILEATCTLSAVVGVSGAEVSNTERFADTITFQSWVNSNISAEVVQPTGDIIGHILADIKGFSKIEFVFHRNSSATSCNALYTLL